MQNEKVLKGNVLDMRYPYCDSSGCFLLYDKRRVRIGVKQYGVHYNARCVSRYHNNGNCGIIGDIQQEKLQGFFVARYTKE